MKQCNRFSVVGKNKGSCIWTSAFPFTAVDLSSFSIQETCSSFVIPPFCHCVHKSTVCTAWDFSEEEIKKRKNRTPHTIKQKRPCSIQWFYANWEENKHLVDLELCREIVGRQMWVVLGGFDNKFHGNWNIAEHVRNLFPLMSHPVRYSVC